MSGFTDEDLKRLKELMHNQTPPSGYGWINYAALVGLLARLEAAEEIASYFSNHPDSAHWWPYAQNAIEAWRKSKGL